MGSRRCVEGERDGLTCLDTLVAITDAGWVGGGRGEEKGKSTCDKSGCMVFLLAQVEVAAKA